LSEPGQPSLAAAIINRDVNVPYFLSKYDPLRYYLTATAPGTRDTESAWEDSVEPQGTTMS